MITMTLIHTVAQRIDKKHRATGVVHFIFFLSTCCTKPFCIHKKTFFGRRGRGGGVPLLILQLVLLIEERPVSKSFMLRVYKDPLLQKKSE